MFKRKNTRKESMRYSEAKQVKVSIIFTRLGEIDTINERFSCEATLFISWQENIEMLKKCDSENSEDDTYYWDPKNFWDPQLYIDSNFNTLRILMSNLSINFKFLFKMQSERLKKRMSSFVWKRIGIIQTRNGSLRSI